MEKGIVGAIDQYLEVAKESPAPNDTYFSMVQHEPTMALKIAREYTMSKFKTKTGTRSE